MEGLEYWVWVAMGIVLALLEIVMPAFFVLLFGLSAVVVGIITFLNSDISLQMQLLVWAVLGGVATVLWFKVFRPTVRPVLREEAVVGQIAMVVADITPARPGRIRFTIPVLGEPEWDASASASIPTGERVSVIGIQNHLLVVETLNKNQGIL